MNAYLLDDGNWLVPRRAESTDGSVVGDAMVKVPPDHPEAVRWARWYKRQGIEPPRRRSKRPGK